MPSSPASRHSTRDTRVTHAETATIPRYRPSSEACLLAPALSESQVVGCRSSIGAGRVQNAAEPRRMQRGLEVSGTRLEHLPGQSGTL